MSRTKVKKKKPYVPGESAKADYRLFTGFFRSLTPEQKQELKEQCRKAREGK